MLPVLLWLFVATVTGRVVVVVRTVVVVYAVVARVVVLLVVVVVRAVVVLRVVVAADDEVVEFADCEADVLPDVETDEGSLPADSDASDDAVVGIDVVVVSIMDTLSSWTYSSSVVVCCSPTEISTPTEVLSNPESLLISESSATMPDDSGVCSVTITSTGKYTLVPCTLIPKIEQSSIIEKRTR